MTITREIDDNLKQLSKVEKSLYHLYQKLESTDNKNPYLEYLKVAVEVEDKILNSIPFTQENSKQLSRELLEFIGEEETSGIEERINNYLERKFFSKPFKSEYEDVNNLLISNSARCDYIVNSLFLLGEEIQKCENVATRKIFETPFYELCFENKIYEHALINPFKEPAFHNQKRCMAFGHEKKKVDNIYQELSHRLISLSLEHLFQYPDIILEGNSEAKTAQRVSLISLKSAAYLLPSEEIYATYQTQYHILTNESPYLQEYFPTTTQNLLTTLKCSYEEMKIYEKKK